MRFVNEIEIDADADALFEFVSDPARVAPCLPGATLEPGDGPEYDGAMRVQVGPVSATYRGQVHLRDVDRERRRAVIVARAREASGAGGAEATIVCSVEPRATGSELRIETDVQLHGRIAQLGGRAIEKVSDRMLKQFATTLERRFQGGEDAAAPPEHRPSLLPAVGDRVALGQLADRAPRYAVAAVLGALVGFAIARILLRLLGDPAPNGSAGRRDRSDLDEVQAR